jgi:hypothetical protein
VQDVVNYNFQHARKGVVSLFTTTNPNPLGRKRVNGRNVVALVISPWHTAMERHWDEIIVNPHETQADSPSEGS